MNLRDILYFDFDKAASLVSQLEGGLSKQRVETTEETEDERNIRKYELLKIFKTEFGGIHTDKSSILETKILHHDLLVKLEETLIALNFATDLNRSITITENSSIEKVHSDSSKTPYIKVEGWCAFEDYNKLYATTENFNDLLSFIKRSEFNGEFNLDTLKDELDQIEENNGRNSKKHKDAKASYQKIEKNIENQIEKSKLPEWLFSGIREWIDSFVKDRLNLRVCPFETFPEIEVIANLKRSCFIDDDLTHLMYAYSSQPNQKLCVLGLVTSVPPQDESQLFDMYKTYPEEPSEEPNEEETDVEGIERAFRAMFPALRNMEKLTSFHRYPRIIVHPIAVYRNIQS